MPGGRFSKLHDQRKAAAVRRDYEKGAAFHEIEKKYEMDALKVPSEFQRALARMALGEQPLTSEDVARVWGWRPKYRNQLGVEEEQGIVFAEARDVFVNAAVRAGYDAWSYGEGQGIGAWVHYWSTKDKQTFHEEQGELTETTLVAAVVRIVREHAGKF